MKQLLQSSGIHRFALFIALAIALGITVHELFLLLAQILALAACLSLMIGVFHHRRWTTTHIHRNL